MADGLLTRRDVLKGGLGVLAGAALPTHRPPHSVRREPGRASLPNIVYIISDQLRACSLGCYGNEDISTPHIDGLAAESAHFGSALSSAPLCAPHRGCLMTGRYPSQHGVCGNNVKLPPEEVCIAEVLGAAGNRTCYIGKWHLDGQYPNPPDPGWVAPEDRQGFQTWVAYNCAHMYYDSLYYLNRCTDPRRIPHGAYEPDWQTAKAVQWITRCQHQPFFLVLSIGTPHPVGAAGSDLPPGGDYHFPYEPSTLTLRPNVDYPDLHYARQEYADYYGIISNIDWNVGRLLTRLEQLGLAEETVVVFSSDHGDFLGSHYGEVGRFRGKALFYNEVVDVPFILRWPGHVEPMLVPGAFTSVDITPTLLGLCGLPVPEGVMGRDFSPVLTGSGPPIEPPWGPVPSTESALTGAYFPAGWMAVRTEDYTLSVAGRSYDPVALYHNTVDPYQLVNVVDDPAYAPIRDALYDELMAWMGYVGMPVGRRRS